MKKGIYFYGWYGGSWLSKTPYQNTPPLLGEYDNTNYGSILTEQAKMISDAGIDFVSISWSKRESYDHVIEAMDKQNIKITCLYETLARTDGKKTVDDQALEEILEDMEIISTYTSDSSWLHIDGKPVIMIYVTRVYPEIERASMRIRQALGPSYLVGDEAFWAEIPEDRLKLFDAVTAYNFYQKRRFSHTSPEDSSKTYLEAVRKMMDIHSKSCRSAKIPFWPVAMPGYDDSYYRPQNQHPPLLRLDGEFFKTSLQDAKNVSDGVVMITSFNEHYEGTGIEPTKEWGDKYLKLASKT